MSAEVKSGLINTLNLNTFEDVPDADYKNCPQNKTELCKMVEMTKDDLNSLSVEEFKKLLANEPIFFKGISNYYWQYQHSPPLPANVDVPADADESRVVLSDFFMQYSHGNIMRFYIRIGKNICLIVANIIFMIARDEKPEEEIFKTHIATELPVDTGIHIEFKIDTKPAKGMPCWVAYIKIDREKLIKYYIESGFKYVHYCNWKKEEEPKKVVAEKQRTCC
ncbi:MAG: hypothetical protein Edafosvirus1_93 [Edafosvirus sp.]|uniref:Uncharacterized protein n=1 Tax=Edafosvirus sp. TaxID=2487765 RepID=A0A3G4ZS78_9VIRU|nr:MAG: hypothetical protein Edafosvirus1_93 [Edafosvirus sp.]